MHVLTLSDRLRPPGVGFGVGWIHVYPASIYGDALAEAERVAAHAVHALGLRDGIAFPQLLVEDDGSVLVVEVAARIPGGQMADLVRHAVGVDLVDVALRFALGDAVPDERGTARMTQPLAIRFLTAEPGPLPTGKVVRVGSLDPVLAAEGVVQADTYLQVGETIRPVRLDGDRRGYVIAVADTSVEALERAEAPHGSWRWRSNDRSAHALWSAPATTPWPTRGRPGRRRSRTIRAPSGATSSWRGCRTEPRGRARLRRRRGGDGTCWRERFRLTGVDLSAEQLRRARRARSGREFVHADFTAIDFEPGSVDAVAAFYSFNHVPRELLAGLFERIHAWLRPGGLFLASLGASDTPGWTGDFLGAPTFFSSFPPERTGGCCARRASSSSATRWSRSASRKGRRRSSGCWRRR